MSEATEEGAIARGGQEPYDIQARDFDVCELFSGGFVTVSRNWLNGALVSQRPVILKTSSVSRGLTKFVVVSPSSAALIKSALRGKATRFTAFHRGIVSKAKAIPMYGFSSPT